MRGFVHNKPLAVPGFEEPTIEEPEVERYTALLKGQYPRQRPPLVRDVYKTSRYDDNLSAYEVQEYNRGTNQGALNKFGSGLVSRASSVIPKIGQGLGHTAGAIWEIAEASADPSSVYDISKIWDNMVVEGYCEKQPTV